MTTLSCSNEASMPWPPNLTSKAPAGGRGGRSESRLVRSSCRTAYKQSICERPLASLTVNELMPSVRMAETSAFDDAYGTEVPEATNNFPRPADLTQYP